jgi:hypothetical protein
MRIIIQEDDFSRNEIGNEYHIFMNPCLTSLGLHQWSIIASRKTQKTGKMVKFRNFQGASDFVNEIIHVTVNKSYFQHSANHEDCPTRTNKTCTTSRMKHIPGTFMMISATHANNFHVIDDILLPIFRLYQKTTITGLLIPEGCLECWKARLPIQEIGFNMMNVTMILYPMEDYIFVANTTNSTNNTSSSGLCFDRLIVQRFKQLPYYKRVGRFSKYWASNLFIDFRNSMHQYVQDLLLSSELKERDNDTIDGIIDKKTIMDNHMERISSSNNANSSTEANNTTMTRTFTKPVLTWMSRLYYGNCWGRCIVNEHEVMTYYSKYFHVNILDLHGAGLAYTAFLPDHAILVELQGEYSNRMFLNMASTMNLPYYAISLNGCIGPGENDAYNISSLVWNDTVEEIYAAYIHEKQKTKIDLLKDDVDASDQRLMVDGKCEFPHPIEPCGHLSSTNLARCYLHQRFHYIGRWHQCPHYRC